MATVHANRFSRPIKYLFSKKCLLLTNTSCFCSLLGLGDFVQQTIGIRIHRTRTQYDWKRTARMASMGLVIGPMAHYWYVFLDGFLPGATLRTVLKKMVCDQMSCPVFSSVFITGLGVLEGQTVSSAFAEYRKKFITIYTLDCCVWPPCQLINFLFLPPQARVIYVNCVQLFYNACMSYIKHEVPVAPAPKVALHTQKGAFITPQTYQYRSLTSTTVGYMDFDWARI